MNDKPNPGSDEAIALGCKCPVLDNGHGKGFILDGERVHWKNAKCPLHGLDLRADQPLPHLEGDA